MVLTYTHNLCLSQNITSFYLEIIIFAAVKLRYNASIGKAINVMNLMAEIFEKLCYRYLTGGLKLSVFVVNFFPFCEIFFSLIVVAMCDPVHDMRLIHGRRRNKI